ncbi:hypothetical protein AVEN_142288-1 [Araneus ventricosus]|uniref:Uncharacterized protein n=1 Tax=Araneus ventricosus TaxID=182803 RepID=A0A4Y2N1J0_ARAVE|nr:hypothetical protein AVEN_142288-1 [Araneus ventricosus]
MIHRMFYNSYKIKKRLKLNLIPRQNNNENRAGIQSKFRTTSSLQVFKSASMQVVESLPSPQAINTAIITATFVESPSVNSSLEAMPIDHYSTSSNDKQIESPEIGKTIEYDPHETIEETPAVIEQQSESSTVSTRSDRATLTQSLL